MNVTPFASIPAPPISSFQLGPLTIHLYGVIIACAVLMAATWTQKRYVAAGGDADTVESLAFWGIVAGFLGGRLGYVVVRMITTDAQGNIVKGYYLQYPEKILAVWEGGLAIFGGLIVGGLTVFFLARAKKSSPAMLFDALAPALPAAQAIGRWGNYFNQELYGTPTDLPWKLYIDPAHRRPGFEQFDYFHPTFLYESLGNIVLATILWRLGKTGRIVNGGLIWVYGMGYGVLRFFMELLRTDTTFRALGLSRNAWVALAIVVVSGTVLFILQARQRAKADKAALDAALGTLGTTTAKVEAAPSETQQHSHADTDGHMADTDGDGQPG